MNSSINEKEKKQSKIGSTLKIIGEYFNIMPDKEDETKSISEISAGIRFRGANLWVLIFAIFIASLGLNINSTAVIIGAMLISPVMGPILGIGLSLGIKDYLLLRRSVKNYLLATLISVVTATIYFMISPYEGAQSELLARTSPTLYDVLIAFFGGLAGVVAACTKGKGNVIPGVAIATALMPPLCTAGYGLATANWTFFLGAFYLFFINTVFIGLATYLGVKFLKFRLVTTIPDKKYLRLGKFIMIGIIISLIPATMMTYRIIRNGFFDSSVQRYINVELDNPGTKILLHKINKHTKVLEVVAVGAEIKEDVIRAARKRLPDYELEDYTLEVIQGSQSDSVMLKSKRIADEVRQKKNTEILQLQSSEILQLKTKLSEYTRFEEYVPQMKQEVNVLFPMVKSLKLSVANELMLDSLSSNSREVVAIVELVTDIKEKIDTEKLKNWLQARIEQDSINVVILPE